jgi:hypothetical protein
MSSKNNKQTQNPYCYSSKNYLTYHNKEKEKIKISPKIQAHIQARISSKTTHNHQEIFLSIFPIIQGFFISKKRNNTKVRIRLKIFISSHPIIKKLIKIPINSSITILL